jgi:hypothetical protein
VTSRNWHQQTYWTGNALMLAALAIVAFIAGCSPTPTGPKDRAVVSGIVTFDGKPLPGGVLNFQSTERPVGATTMIKSGGAYSTDRAPLGNNVVTIETASLQFGNGAAFVRIPVKYSDPKSSGLVVDVHSGANENVNFELKK